MYNVYDKPWRPGGGAADHVYRPSKTIDKDIYGDDVEKLINTSRFVYMGGGEVVLKWAALMGGGRVEMGCINGGRSC